MSEKSVRTSDLTSRNNKRNKNYKLQVDDIYLFIANEAFMYKYFFGLYPLLVLWTPLLSTGFAFAEVQESVNDDCVNVWRSRQLQLGYLSPAFERARLEKRSWSGDDNANDSRYMLPSWNYWQRNRSKYTRLDCPDSAI